MLVGFVKSKVVYAGSKSKRVWRVRVCGGIDEAVLCVISGWAGSDVGDGVCPSSNIEHDCPCVARAREPPLSNLS